MTKNIKGFRCSSCEYLATMWCGQCPSCKSWNSLEEQGFLQKTLKQKRSPISTEDICFSYGDTQKVFGGHLTRGSITLLAGSPGVGKSTFLLKLIKSIELENDKIKCCYISGEETVDQVLQRVQRLSLDCKSLEIFSLSIWQDAKEIICRKNFDIVFIDSIQTIRDDDLPGQAGTTNQLRSLTSEIIECFKQVGITTILVGHVTKEGNIAGPKHVEHMVDTVLKLEKDKGEIRFLKSTKNRFGSTGEKAFYKMLRGGLDPLAKSSTFPKIKEGECGTAYTIKKEGNELSLVEIQALVLENKYNQGKRVVIGLDSPRLNTILAVVEKSLQISLSCFDVYIKVAPSLDKEDDSSDLAICLAILSSYFGKPVGKLGLGQGSLRLSGEFGKVLLSKEAFGFKKELSLPSFLGSFENREGKDIIKIENLNDLKQLVKDKAV